MADLPQRFCGSAPHLWIRISEQFGNRQGLDSEFVGACLRGIRVEVGAGFELEDTEKLTSLGVGAKDVAAADNADADGPYVVEKRFHG